MAAPARSIYNLTYDQLSERLADWGEPSFRVQQVWQWLYQSLVTETAAMRNIPLALRRRLEEGMGMGMGMGEQGCQLLESWQPFEKRKTLTDTLAISRP